MKSTKYSRFCRRIFSNAFDKFNINETSKNWLLEKADISMVYKEYYSMVFMNIILGFISSFATSSVIYLIFANQITAFLILIISSIVPLSMGLYYLSLPSAKSKNRGKNIDRYLPYATNFINTMSLAGISPAEIFETLSTVKLYGDIQKEAQKITTEIELMGIDTITALKNAIHISPSEKFKEFIQGMIGVIQSGSELGPYFNRCVERYMESDLFERRRNLESLAIMAEAFVVTVIAFPLFLVIIFSIMGLTSGGVSFDFLFILAFGILPMAYFGFYIMMKSGMGDSV
ncbi:MAG: type II secretion system F family protein [Candidatus Thermoplasmatota archaeon]|nr:type II secretion system F family protein [Candidatus Thermoplasmatota archaeon]MCK5300875.1 type II secretion system F family protein [Thermoplasmatales archaeon]